MVQCVLIVQDIDDYFSKQREWAAEYAKASREAAVVSGVSIAADV